MGFRGAVATLESLCSPTSPGVFDDPAGDDDQIVD
jgi:hypothetical protein